MLNVWRPFPRQVTYQIMPGSLRAHCGKNYKFFNPLWKWWRSIPGAEFLQLRQEIQGNRLYLHSDLRTIAEGSMAGKTTGKICWWKMIFQKKRKDKGKGSLLECRETDAVPRMSFSPSWNQEGREGKNPDPFCTCCILQESHDRRLKAYCQSFPMKTGMDRKIYDAVIYGKLAWSRGDVKNFSAEKEALKKWWAPKEEDDFKWGRFSWITIARLENQTFIWKIWKEIRRYMNTFAPKKSGAELL